MIIKYSWLTCKRCKKRLWLRNQFVEYEAVTRRWHGWFLLGIIPLYIVCEGATYER